MASSSGPVQTPAGSVYYAPPPAMDAGEGGGFQLRNLLKVLRRRRRTFLLTVLAVTVIAGSQAVAKRMFSPVFQGGFTLLISDPVNEAGASGSNEGGAISSVARNVTRVDVPTLIRVLESPTVMEPVNTQLRQRYANQSLPSVSVSLVSTGVGGQTILSGGVLAVAARGGDPALVRETLQLTEQAFLDWALQQRREKLTEGVKFLDEQEPVLRGKSNALQAELEQFRNRHNVLAPGEEAQAVRGQVEGLRTTLLTQQAERSRLQQLRADVASGRLTARGFETGSGGGDSGGTVNASVPGQSLLEELTRLETEIATARATYQPGTPMLDNLTASRDRLLPELRRQQLDAVDAALEQLDTAIRGTDGSIARLEGRFSSQPALLREFENLKGRLDIAEGNLGSYLRTREQFQLEIAQNNVPWKVIAPTAVSSVPVEPQLSRGLLQGLMLGLLAGTAAALVHDRLDHVFHSPGEVRDELNQPLLGHVPYISFFQGVRRDKRFLLRELDSDDGGLAGYQRFSYQEAFRNLYTSLRFLNTGRQVRSVALSSSVPGEGKSLTIVLLAKTLSELGQRVLLVDADLRKPQMHHRLGLDNLVGLTTLLTEEERPWRDVVQPVPDYPNWDVITAGRRPPDPPRLLSSARMARLVKEIAETGGYDLILYDTPPALGLADAALVAEQLDGIVLLVSLNKVDRGLPAEALQRIEASGAPLLGVVTNARIARMGAERPYGGAGYGGDGYGYAEHPYDPSVAYGYYRSGEPAQEQPGNRWAALVPSRRNFGRWGQGLRRWLQG